MKHLIRTVAVAAILGGLPAHAHDGDHTCENGEIAKDIDLIKPVAAPTGETQLTPEIEAEIDETIAETEAMLAELEADEPTVTQAADVVEEAETEAEGGRAS